MNCPSCGQELGPGQACPRCGRTVSPESSPETPQTESPWARPDSSWEWAAPASPPVAPEAVPSEPEPTVAFGTPQQYAASIGPDQRAAEAAGGVATSGASPQPAPARKPRLSTPLLVVTLAVLLVGGAVAAAGYYFGWLGGGGPSPSQAMPASTVAYLQLDLNPSPAQKAQAWQFLRELPEVRQAVASGQADPKRLLWELLDDWWIFDTDDDFDTEVAPWLGDRVGVGLVKSGDRAAVMTAIAAKNEAAAAAKLRAWIRDSQQAFDVTTRDGFALITMTSDTYDVLAELDRGTLAGSQTFADDLASVGEPGFLAGWANLAGLASLNPSWPTSGSDAVTGRTAFALRFDSDSLDFAGKALGLNRRVPTTTATGELGSLPSSTGFGFSVSGGAAAVRAAWPTFRSELDSLVSAYGLSGDDVGALLGRSFSIGIPAVSIADSGGQPVVGVRVVTDAAPARRASCARWPTRWTAR